MAFESGRCTRFEAQTDIWIMSGIFHRMREMWPQGWRRIPRPDPEPDSGDYTLNLTDPDPEELAKDMNGRGAE